MPARRNVAAGAVVAACFAIPIVQAFCPMQALKRSWSSLLSSSGALRARTTAAHRRTAVAPRWAMLFPQDSPSGAQKKPLIIPTIDISAMSSDNEATRSKVGDALRSACESSGFFYVSGHGIPDRVLADAFACSRDFFSLPDEVKKAIPSTSGGFTRGYIEMGGESGSAERFEVKEAFSYGFEWGTEREWANPMQGPNVWPEESGLMDAGAGRSRTERSWRSSLVQYYNENVRVCEMITGALARALGKEEQELLRFCRKGGSMSGGETISLMRLFHYLPYERAGDLGRGQQRIGSSPHTDWGFLTLILQDPHVLGLQAFDKETGWIDIPPKPGTLVCNIGDYVSLITGGQFVSPLHRVVTAEAERYSFVFFYYPSYEASMPVAIQGRDMSLFKNQKVQEDDARKLQATQDVPFGEFILRKWEQVQRNMS